MNEEHNQKLSATVDKLLSDSNERLQLHLQERMRALEEKNHLSQDLERTRKILEDMEMEKHKIFDQFAKQQHEIDILRHQLQAFRPDRFVSVLMPHLHLPICMVSEIGHISILGPLKCYFDNLFEILIYCRSPIPRPQSLQDDPSKV